MLANYGRSSRMLLRKLQAPSALFSSAVNKKLFDKILIANRGEIACRVIRTAKKLGIKTVACYSDADANSLHVEMADEAVHIGPSPAAESYLRGDKIIAAAKLTGAQAIHPGYGFLSENLNFCKLCDEAGVVFIGPPQGAIRSMGSKSESKDIMIRAKVPVTPGYHGADQSDATLLAEAKRIGFPLMIKAVSGGGGKGMRAVFEESKFLSALESCRREALKSFSDDVVLIEKLVRAPRHVELQVFGDTFGNAVHLFERDCSVQRRHQKVLEEAPAPNLPADVRKAMGDAAVACAKAVGYVGAGTVEFLVDSVSNEFYFCEMNTRLQVEHPVTEMITGQDLVEWQLRVASGQPLPMSQEQLAAVQKGCSIEARIYAENPVNDFLPTTGYIGHMRTPVGVEEGMRADFGIRSGDSISTFYDPMIAKLIVYDDTRDKAVRKLERALRGFQVAGLPNNIDFLVHCVRNSGFAEKQATTAFFDENMADILAKLNAKNSLDAITDHAAFALSALTIESRGNTSNEFFPWSASCGDWRGFATAKRNVTLRDAAGDAEIVISSKDADLILGVKGAAETRKSTVKSARKIPSGKGCQVWEVTLDIDNHRRSGTVAMYQSTKGDTIIDEGEVGDSSTHFQYTIPKADYASGASTSGRPTVASPMPGRIIKVNVTHGQNVKAGDTLVIMEAMKMEHVIASPCDGVVNLLCEEGASVNEGTLLAEVVAADAKEK